MRFSLRSMLLEIPLLWVLVYCVIWNFQGVIEHRDIQDRNPWIGLLRKN